MMVGLRAKRAWDRGRSGVRRTKCCQSWIIWTCHWLAGLHFLLLYVFVTVGVPLPTEDTSFCKEGLEKKQWKSEANYCKLFSSLVFHCKIVSHWIWSFKAVKTAGRWLSLRMPWDISDWSTNCPCVSRYWQRSNWYSFIILFGLRRKCAQWIHKLLTQSRRVNRWSFAVWLDEFEPNVTKRCSDIATGDECWIFPSPLDKQSKMV